MYSKKKMIVKRRSIINWACVLVLNLWIKYGRYVCTKNNCVCERESKLGYLAIMKSPCMHTWAPTKCQQGGKIFPFREGDYKIWLREGDYFWNLGYGYGGVKEKFSSATDTDRPKKQNLAIFLLFLWNREGVAMKFLFFSLLGGSKIAPPLAHVCMHASKVAPRSHSTQP